MAFDSPLPSPSDFLRDPLGSFGRLGQILNSRLDQWNAMGKDIPVLYARIRGYEAALKTMKANAARQSVVDQLTRNRLQLDEFVAKRNSLTGKVIEAINAVRNEAARLQRPMQVVGVSAVPLVAPIAIAVAGIAVYGITQLVRDWLAIKATNDSLGVRILEYGKQAGLTPEQIGAVAGNLSRLPKAQGPSGFFGEIEAMLPAVLGIAALVIFGPTLVQMIQRRRAA